MTDTAPLSRTQERLWFEEQLKPGTTAYHMPLLLRIDGPLDLGLLQRAVDTVVGRHDALRTVFRAEDGSPTQCVVDGTRVPVDTADLRDRPDPVAAATTAAMREARRPFRLEDGPLLRVLALRVADEAHLLLFVAHHIVCDGWSLGILFHELSLTYAAASAGEEPALRPLARQFADVVRAERERLTGEAADALLDWWRGYLAEVPKVLELPADRPRPAVRGHHGATRRVSVDAATAQGVRGLARAHEATLFMTLLAAFGVVLSRQTGQERMVVGTPAVTRGAGTRDVIGCLLNTLAVRLDAAENPSFSDLVGRVKDDSLAAISHQRVPFERLVSDLAPERDLSRSGLVQVFFNLLPPMATLELPGCTTRQLHLEDVDNKFDLTLYVSVEDGGFSLEAAYDTALYGAERVDDLLRQLRGVLTQAVAEPATRIGDFALATEQAVALQLAAAAPAGEPAADEQAASLLDRLARHAANTPERAALVGADRVWTYREVEEATDRLAGQLRAQGIGRGDVLAVYATRGPAAVLGMLAASKVSAVFAVLDAGHPEGALRRRARALDPRGWIDCAGGRALPYFAAGPVFRPDADGPAGGPAGPPPGPGDAAYLAFTSGTTGRPRPVIGTHGPVAHFLRWYTRSFHLGPEDRFAVLSGLGHDPFLRDVLTPLWVGGAAVFPPADIRDTAAVAEWLAGAGITVAHLTPALGRSLAEQAEGRSLGALRLLGFGGDVLTGPTVRSWRRLAPGARILNMYGATETPQAVSVHVVGEDTEGSASVPLGRGIDEVEVLVLAGDRLAGVGEIGEIVVRTAHLTRYAQDDGPSGFTADPLSGAAGGRVYRTGDLARLRPDGLIDHLGRADRQVKVRGFRVEPAEVEAVLGELPGVRQCAVFATPGPAGDHRLVGCVCTDGDGPDLPSLRAALSRRLPDHLVPASFIVLDDLPLTPNGKVDLAALRSMGGEETSTGPYEEPAGATERRLAEVWREVLGRERIGRNDDFFALGGHSLLLTRVLARLRGRFAAGEHGPVRLQDLFERPTIAELAELLGGSSAPARPAEVARHDETLPAPLSWTQERLWFEEQLRPGDAAYNMPVVLRVRGPLDPDRLQHAVDAVVERHAVLRAVFTLRDGVPAQRCEAGSRVRVERQDVAGAADPRSAAVAAAMASVKRPFDLERGPLLRVLLIRAGDEEQLLVLVAHHIVFDGWSFGVLLKDLSRAYTGERLAAPALQFPDVARWERTELAGEALDELLAWWRGHLDGVPRVLELPTSRPRPAVQRHRGERRRLSVDAGTAAGLRALAGAGGSTLFMVLLAAYSTVLSRYSGQRDLLVGVPVANRSRAEFEDMVGCFLNTLPIRVDLHGEPSFRDVLSRVRDSSLEAFAHQRVPFGRLVAELAPERDLSRGPVVQVLFALQNMDLGTLAVPGTAAEFVEVSQANSQFDLNLRMIDNGREIVGWLDYDAELFGTAAIERFVEHFTNVLAAVAADPSAPVHTIDLLGPAERARLVERWNDTATDLPAERTLTDLLGEAGRRFHDRTAVRFEDEQVTHAELHRRANRLAHRLRALGVGPDTVVGVHLERSIELVVALLAVLKAGGAYLPLDPGYPHERLAFMLADSAAPVLLTAAHPRDGLAGDGLTVVTVDERAGDGYPQTDPRPATGPDHLAYVIYTSGSTGRPKGVQVPHRGIVNRLLWMQDAYRLDGGDAVLQKTPISFDVSVWELFWPLTTGARLVLATPGGQRDPDYLTDLIARESVTVCHFVPPMLDAFLGARRAAACPSLRLVVCSGEALPADLARRFHAASDAALENLYGPTEASVDVTRWSCRRGWEEPTVPLGTPIANTRAYVLDDHLLPAPTGVPGELYLGGVQVARGYGGRPGLTAGRFVPDPFGPPGSRLYRTGDLARWTVDGRLDYLGRADHQVKVRGFRIELGEIEAALLALDGVAQAVAIVREDQPGTRRIVAYLTPEATKAPPDPGELRAALRSRLPEHMVPGALVVLDALPLGPSGKVDRSALAAPDRSVEAAGYVAPRTREEEILAGVLAQVLDLDRVGVTDNFFEIGGDSMHAVRIVGLARDQGLDIPLDQLFTRQTVEALAQWLATQGAGTARRQEVSAFGLLSAEDLARLRST